MTTKLTRRTVVSSLLSTSVAGTSAMASTPVKRQTWTFDNLQTIGGHPAHLEGSPSLVDSPFGKAVQFNGVDDAIFIEDHPLAGATVWTVEAYFRPDGGPLEQRWLYIGEPIEGAYATDPLAAPRIAFEIRALDAGWYLDAVVQCADRDNWRVLQSPDKLYPYKDWFHVAQSYDGATYRSFVNGILQKEAPYSTYTPQGPGVASIGTRLNRKSYFRGAVRQVRFSPRCLSPRQFLPNPKS